MVRRDSLQTVSKTVTLPHDSYQGNSYDPPDAHHIEGHSNHVQDLKSSSLKSKLVGIGQFLSSLRLEIVAFVFTFSYITPMITTTSLILEKVCLTSFKYPEEICQNLVNHTTIKIEVERLATNYQIGHTLLQTAPAAVIACFTGPWSDHYGRRAPVIVAISGMTLDAIGTTICAIYSKSHVGYMLIPAVFTGLSGGLVTNLAVVYSYASDLTPLHKRTAKYAFLEIANGFAQPLGALAGGWIFNFFGYASVYLLSSAGLCVSIMLVHFLLPETRGLRNADSWQVKLKAFMSCKTFGESFKAVAKIRPHKGRLQITLLILSICFMVVSNTSSSQINFLYVHHQFNWSNTVFSSITALYSCFAIVIVILLLPLLRYYKAGDPALGIMGSTSLIFKYVGIGLSYKAIIYHIASLAGLLSVLAPLAVRSRISKLVSNDDLGKVFSFVAVSESLLPLLSSVLISQIFNAFLPVFPGMPYLVIAVALTLPFSVFVWISFLPVLKHDTSPESAALTKEESYTKIDNE